MRPARKRFTKPRQSQSVRRKAIGDGSSTSRYMNNAAGRAAMREALGEQRRKQNALCADCSQFMPWGECKFKFRSCPDGAVNVAVHKKC